MKQQETMDLIARLQQSAAKINQLKSFVGFDGYIDQIIRIVKSRSSLTDYAVFQKIAHFAEYLQETSGKSAGLEMISTEFKFGGNAPIMAHSLAKQGVQTVCAGTFGDPNLHPAFEEFAEGCTAVTVGMPAVTYAFEFQDGKLMFGDVSSLNQMDWDSLKQTIGLDTIIQNCVDSQLISIVNWSGIFQIGSILTGFLDDVFPKVAERGLADKWMFVDIADPSARTEEDLQMFIELLSRFSQQTRVLLGLNEKEARFIFKKLGFPADPAGGLKEMAEKIYDQLNVSALVIHATRRVIGINQAGTVEADTLYVDNPVISTGAGDHFNSGFCLGQMLAFSMKHCLLLGVAVSSFYVGKGFSPSLDQVMEYLAATSAQT
jgi:hypothetical protein